MLATSTLDRGNPNDGHAVDEISPCSFRPALLRDGREAIEVLDAAGATLYIVPCCDPRYPQLYALAYAADSSAFERGGPPQIHLIIAIGALTVIVAAKMFGVL